MLSMSSGTVPFVGNSVIIKFHSEADLSIGGRGYRIRVGQSSSPVIPSGCGGFITTATASLQSPNYPNSYPPNSDCRYVVQKVSRDICQLQIKVTGHGSGNVMNWLFHSVFAVCLHAWKRKGSELVHEILNPVWEAEQRQAMFGWRSAYVSGAGHGYRKWCGMCAGLPSGGRPGTVMWAEDSWRDS